MDNKNVFALIVAGGIGSRMGSDRLPKQFLDIGDKPIILHTIEKFFSCDKIQEIIVLTPPDWVAYTKELVHQFFPQRNNIVVTAGGADRNGTIMNGIAYIETNYGLCDDTIIVTHDSVRPFINDRIIEENIAEARRGGACGTFIPATDTIIKSADGSFVSEIPERELMYQAQTPQSFRALLLKEAYTSLSDEEKALLTDACKILVLKGVRVRMVMGDRSNIKLTYPEDLTAAEAILQNRGDKK